MAMDMKNEYYRLQASLYVIDASDTFLLKLIFITVIKIQRKCFDMSLTQNLMISLKLDLRVFL